MANVNQPITVIPNPSTAPILVTTPLIPNPLTVNQGAPGSQPWLLTGTLTTSGSNATTIASGTSNINVGNFPTVQEVYVVNQAAASANVNVTNASLPIANVPGLTVAVSGRVTATSGTLNAHIDNFPLVQAVGVQNFPATQPVTVASGTSNVNIGNFPTVQEVFVTNSTSNQVTQGTTPWLVANNPGQTIAVSGIITSVSGTQFVNVVNYPTIQTTSVSNFPATQAVTIASGSSNVNIGNFPTIQTTSVPSFTASGIQHTAIDNFPTVQSVSLVSPSVLNISNAPGVTLAVSGTISSILSASGVHNVHVDNFPTTQGVSVQNFPASQPVTIASGTSNVNVGNFPTIQEVFVVNQSASAANVNVTNSSLPIVNLAGNTLAVSGIVTAASGTLNAHVDNWPLVQHVFVENQAGSAANVNVTNTPSVTIASGTSNINVGNFPTIQEVFVVNQSSNSANVNVTNASIPVTQFSTPWLVQIQPGLTTAVSGVVTALSGTLNAHIDNFPTIQTTSVPAFTASGVQHTAIDNFPTIQSVSLVSPSVLSVSGTVTNTPGVTLAVSGTISSILSASGVHNVHVDNFPTVQGVNVLAGQLAVTNFPATQPVTIASGTSNINVGNFPTVQSVFVTNSTSSQVTQGTTPWLVANNPGQTLAVSGVVIAASGTLNVHVDNYPTIQTVNIPTFTTSGVQHTVIDNYPTVQSVSLVAPSVLSVSGTVTNTPGVTLAVSGTISSVLSASGLQNVHVDNWPSIQGVNVQTGQLAVTNFPATQPVTIASGTSNVNVGNFPTVQSVFVTNPSSSGGSVTQGTTPWITQVQPGLTTAVSGIVMAASGTLNAHIDNWPTTQGVSVQNFPATQAVTIASGTSNINVGNFPTIQEVYVVNQSSNSANVNVTNSTLAVTQSTNPWTVSGTSAFMVEGYLTNNFTTASGSYNLGVLPGVANTSPPTWKEGTQVLESMDLSGNQRTTLGTLLAGENLTTNRLNVEPIYSYQNITSNTTTTVKSGAGTLHAIAVNNTGTSSSITIYDNTAGSGTKIGTIGATVETTMIYDASFATGLTIVTTGTTAADITVLYR